jgi:hypothetical protein
MNLRGRAPQTAQDRRNPGCTCEFPPHEMTSGLFRGADSGRHAAEIRLRRRLSQRILCVHIDSVAAGATGRPQSRALNIDFTHLLSMIAGSTIHNVFECTSAACSFIALATSSRILLYTYSTRLRAGPPPVQTAVDVFRMVDQRAGS